ncbi:MAG TPA: aspartyl/asparaginyl beta-hydroxylase domain-containing protein [Pyrinomonadaceae bacterium]
MLSSYKLPLAFDAAALKADLERIPAGEWVAHFNRGDYEGEWKGLALRSTTGRANQLFTFAQDTTEAADTPVLGQCPYFRRVLAAFECPIHAARLLSLGPGSKILEHSDVDLGGEDGLLRVHVPVVTDGRVEFFVGGRRLLMAEGEAWCIDFSLPHRVTNGSDKDRVHLVVDCRVNGWLESLLPFGGGRG